MFKKVFGLTMFIAAAIITFLLIAVSFGMLLVFINNIYINSILLIFAFSLLLSLLIYMIEK